MRKWVEYGKNAAAYATPYVRQAGAYAEDAAIKLGKSYRKSRRLVKRDMRLSRINRILSFISHIFLILASVATLLAVLKNFFED